MLTQMQFKLRTLLLIITVICAFFVLRPVFLFYAMDFDTSMQTSYEQIQLGQHVDDAIELLGESHVTSDSHERWLSTTSFSIASKNPDFSEFLTWKNGNNCSYSVGVDAKGVILGKFQTEP